MNAITDIVYVKITWTTAADKNNWSVDCTNVGLHSQTALGEGTEQSHQL